MWQQTKYQQENHSPNETKTETHALFFCTVHLYEEAYPEQEGEDIDEPSHDDVVPNPLHGIVQHWKAKNFMFWRHSKYPEMLDHMYQDNAQKGKAP